MHRVQVEEELMQNFFFFQPSNVRPRALRELTTGRVALHQIDESRTVVSFIYLFIFTKKSVGNRSTHMLCV